MPRKSNDPTATSRRQAILTLLQRAGTEGLTIREIWDRLISRAMSVTKRTIERDMEWLSTENRLMSSDTRPIRFSLLNDIDAKFKITLSDDHLKTLSMALSNLRQTAPDYFSKLCNQFETDLMSALPPEIGDKLERFKALHMTYAGHGGKSLVKNAKVLNLTLEALFHGRELEIEGYRAPGDAPGKSRANTRLGPLFMEMNGGHSYLMAELLGEGTRKVKKFRLSRFEGLRLGGNYSPSAALLKERGVESFWGYTANDPNEILDVRIVFTETLRAYFSETEVHRSQQVKFLDNGTVEVRFRVPIAFPFVRIIQGFAQEIIEIDPPELRDWLLKHLQAALKNMGAA